jgi:opacity protein-like surface antigen
MLTRGQQRQPGVCRRLPHLAGLALLVTLGAVTPARAQDTDQFRFYFGPRSGIAFQTKGEAVRGVEVSSGQQLNGFNLGVNLGRHLGFEVAGDAFQTDLVRSGHGKLGEYGMFSLIPQVRLRYPLLDDRLTPYVVGGVGVQLAEFNDRKPAGVGARIDAHGMAAAASLGAGIEYYVADNVAVGLETRYLVSRDQEIRVDDRGGRANLDALLTTIGLRLLFPEGPEAPRPYQAPTWRPYIGIRVGGQTFIHENLGNGLEMDREQAAIGGVLNQYFHIAGGVDIGRHFGAGLAVEGFKGTLRLAGVGDIGKLSLYVVMPEVRARYPLLDDRLVPYALAGLGVSYAEVHDVKPPGFDLRPDAANYSPVGALGAGVDYFVVRNIAVGLETKYLIVRDHAVTVHGQTSTVNLDSFVTSVGLRVYFR